MNDKLFLRMVAILMAVGTISCFSHAAYTIYRHNRTSIITYIGNEK